MGLSCNRGFQIDATDSWSSARATSFNTAHCLVQTPIFMPVATHAALRGVDSTTANSLGFQVLLANTYHLLLRPGLEVFKKFGGIHRFMNWPNSILTDSGGFQIFSLAKHLRMEEQGARFRSYVDGAQIFLTPELSIQAQQAIGSDIMMVLDHCIDSTSDYETTRAAMELTTRWAKRSFEARVDPSQALFGIIQGGSFPELRRESASQICAIPFDGFAIGGLAVGEERSVREDMIEITAALLPPDKSRYLMGVGTPIDLLEAVKRGVDMFDCILPTSLAHQGVCFTSHGKIDLRRGVYASVEVPVDATCECTTCARYSRAYLSHLIRAGEYLGGHLLSIHNLVYYHALMAQMRQNILAGTFKEFYLSQRDQLARPDDDFPPSPPTKKPRINELVLGDYQVVENESGTGSIQQISSGEIMHSVIEPEIEARQLYLNQSNVVESCKSEGAPLIIWDVGLGAATNAMTAIIELESIEARARKVDILSFEQDLDPLRLALKHPRLFKHIRHQAPGILIEQSFWENETKDICWALAFGDFKALAAASPAPDIIWYDPFSYKVDSELWQTQFFKKLLSHCAGKETRLITYSASTAVRAAMLAAGWYVGPGLGSGPKSETTIAYTASAAGKISKDLLLGANWLDRWHRSDAKIPLGSDSATALEQVKSHPQFLL